MNNSDLGKGVEAYKEVEAFRRKVTKDLEELCRKLWENLDLERLSSQEYEIFVDKGEGVKEMF
jgi:hypothetical protein